MIYKFFTLTIFMAFIFETGLAKNNNFFTINSSDSSDFWSDDFGSEFIEKGFKSWFEHPIIDIYGGKSSISIDNKGYLGDFNKTDFSEIRLGYFKIRTVSDKNILKINNSSLMFSFINPGWFSKPEKTVYGTNMKGWRVGIISSNGYGYDIGGSAKLLLTHSESSTWSKVEFPDGISQSLDPYDIKGTYEDGIRFGKMFEAGLKFIVVEPVSLSFGYERNVIYPRHLFWKWLVSSAIEGAGQGLLDGFIRAIGRKMPVATPIVNFILKNGLSYGYYELLKKNMNWPFETAPPLMLDNLKFGISFIF